MAKDFLGFIASVEGTEVLTEAIAPSGPYVINGSSLPDDVLPAVKDIQTYLDANAAAPALEFLSPVKGPALEQITVAVGTGQYSAEEARAAVRPGRGEAGASSSACRAGSRRRRGALETGQRRPLPLERAMLHATSMTRAPAEPPSLGAYPYWFYLPAAIVFGVIFVVPTVLAFYYSLTRWTLFDASSSASTTSPSSSASRR